MYSDSKLSGIADGVSQRSSGLVSSVSHLGYLQ